MKRDQTIGNSYGQREPDWAQEDGDGPEDYDEFDDDESDAAVYL